LKNMWPICENSGDFSVEKVRCPSVALE